MLLLAVWGDMMERLQSLVDMQVVQSIALHVMMELAFFFPHRLFSFLAKFACICAVALLLHLLFLVCTAAYTGNTAVGGKRKIEEPTMLCQKERQHGGIAAV